jgi:hypothetical protein
MPDNGPPNVSADAGYYGATGSAGVSGYGAAHSGAFSNYGSYHGKETLCFTCGFFFNVFYCHCAVIGRNKWFRLRVKEVYCIADYYAGAYSSSKPLVEHVPVIQQRHKDSYSPSATTNGML